MRCNVNRALAVIGLGVVAFAVTLVGLPVAAILGMLLFASTMISPLFVALALGKKLTGAVNLRVQDPLSFILGFLVLSVLSSLVSIGWVIYVIAASLGMGAMLYAARENWDLLTARPMDHEADSKQHSR